MDNGGYDDIDYRNVGLNDHAEFMAYRLPFCRIGFDGLDGFKV